MNKDKVERWRQLHGVIPRFDPKANTKIIARVAAAVLGIRRVEVSFVDEDVLHKIYRINRGNDHDPAEMRVSLPVCPRLKTRSEVATLTCLR